MRKFLLIVNDWYWCFADVLAHFVEEFISLRGKYWSIYGWYDGSPGLALK